MYSSSLLVGLGWATERGSHHQSYQELLLSPPPKQSFNGALLIFVNEFIMYQYAISFMAGKKQVPVSTSETTPIYYLVDSEHSNNLHLLTLIRAFIKFQVTCSLDHHTCTKLVTLWVILSTTSSFSDKQ